MKEKNTVFSFVYTDGEPDEIMIRRYPGGSPSLPRKPMELISSPVHKQQVEVSECTGLVYVYCSFLALPANPVRYADNQPSCRQTVTIGLKAGEDFAEAITFGILDDGRASPKEQANYVPGLLNGRIDYFGMYARPGTVYAFKIIIALDCQTATAWVCGHGNDEWFPLAIEAELTNPVHVVNAARIYQHPKASGIENLLITSNPCAEQDALPPHSKANLDPLISPEKKVHSRTMRSLWRRAERHVTVARTPQQDLGWWQGYWPGWWLGFPDVVQTGPASLVCVHNDGPAHGGGGAIWVRHSKDLGKTWTRSSVLRPRGCNCPRIQKLNDGTLLITADLYPNPYNVVFYHSTDGGRTWKEIGLLDPVAAGGNCGCVPSRIVETADGAWVVGSAYYPGQKPFTGELGCMLEFFRSSDQGKTWTLYSSIEADPPHSISEPSIVSLPDGRWVLFARENYAGLPGVRSISTDEGKTWSSLEELPFGIHGRPCAGMLRDGRILLTFRNAAGPVGLWAWMEDMEEAFPQFAYGMHFNDTFSHALKEDGLYIDSDGARGQFTMYRFRCPDGPDVRVDVTVEVKTLSNQGHAATLSVPYVGKFRIFPDRIEKADDSSLCISIANNTFHTLRIIKESPNARLFVDGLEASVFSKEDETGTHLAWSPLVASYYPLEFGNEAVDDAAAAWDWVPEGHVQDRKKTSKESPKSADISCMFQKSITPAVTGCSVWKRMEATYTNPDGSEYSVSWNAKDGVFPDQYQLDRIVEVEGTISGVDQGYSGWTQLDDGRIFVLNYTDDTARWNQDETYPPLGVAWIRGTFLQVEDFQRA